MASPENAIEPALRLLEQLDDEIAEAGKSCNAAAVHHVRVAIRRFTQAVAAFGGASEMRKGRRRLKKIRTAAGEVRNCDVALKHLEKWDADELQPKIEERRKESAKRLAGELEQWAKRDMTSKWREVLRAGETSPGQTAQDAVRPLAAEFLERGKHAASPHASAREMHHFRLVAKKFRYTLELLEPSAARMAKIKRLSALLGDINDCVTMAAMLSEYRGGHHFASRLKRRQEHKTAEFREYWRNQFGEGQPLRAWIEQLGKAPKKPVGRSEQLRSRRHSAA